MIRENLIGPSIVANSGHLPRNFHPWLVGLDREAIVLDLPQYDGLRELANDGEQVADVAIERVKVSGKVNVGEALMICDHISVADARHVMGFDNKMPRGFVAGVKRFHQWSHSFDCSSA